MGDVTRRLAHPTLATLPSTVARPSYDAAGLPVGIVHLGIGAFHRAHQAIYTDDAIAASGGAWGISGVSLRSPEVRDRMMPQDGLYTAVEQEPRRRAAAHRRQRARGSVPGRRARKRRSRGSPIPRRRSSR